MNTEYLHEDLSRESIEEKSTERGLGITFAVVFAIIGAVRLYLGLEWWGPMFGAAAVFLLLAYFWTAPLRPLNNIWHRFGLLLFRVVNPVIMAIIFYSSIFPVGLLLRIFQKDVLKLKLDRDAETYWEERVISEASPKNMKNQF